MKIRLLIILLLPVLVSAQAKKLTVTGKITGLKDGTKVIMIDVNKQTDTLATTLAKGGAFVLNAELKEPLLVGISLGAPNLSTLAFLENSSVKLTGSISDVKNLKFSGSSSQKDFVEFQRIFNPPFEKLVKANQQMQMGGVTDSLRDLSTQLMNSIQTSIDEFVNKHKSSAVSAFLLAATIQLKDDILLTEKRFNQLKPSATENMYGNYIKQLIATTKITAIGSQMDFTQPDTLGNPVALSSFRGKYVLVDFWASWCGPCRQENPNVVSSFNKFKEKNFTVLGVSLDRPGQKDKWLQAIHTDNLAWTHVSDLLFWNNAVAQQYKIESIPQNFLLDPQGKIVAKNLRGPALDEKLCEILGCN